MKPAPFKYVEVTDEAALAAALADEGDEARILAGGQSLVPMMNFRIIAPAVLIDVNRVNALDYLERDDDVLRIGALTRHATVEDSSDILRHCPLLTHAVRHVAHRAVRNRGTLGGSLALAYPGAEMPLALVTLGAEVELASARGTRHVPVDEFIIGALDTTLAADEYIRGVDIRLPPRQAAASFTETSRRHGDFAIGAAAVIAARDRQGNLGYVRAGISGGTGAPIRLQKIEEALRDSGSDLAALAGAAHAAIAAVEVFGDHHYPEDYRRHVLQALLTRALSDALARAEISDVH
jgi:aerobic carbon-monoxide dehydrogenase medium subunit